MTRDGFPVVVHVLLWRVEELFLLRRANTGFLEFFYELPGGNCHPGGGGEEDAGRSAERGYRNAATNLRRRPLRFKKKTDTESLIA